MKGWELRQLDASWGSMNYDFVLLKIEERGENQGSFSRCHSQSRVNHMWNSTAQHFSTQFRLLLITEE